MSKFFNEKQAAAILKHGILSRYLAIFASKTGIRAPDHRVVYLDSYAGPGIYATGEPGSPAFAQQTAEILAKTRNLEGIYIEEEKDSARQLKQFLDATAHVHTVLQGPVEARLDEALEQAGDEAPMFAFFDPFGLPVPMGDLQKVFARSKKTGWRREGPATEILLNVSYPGIRRTAGHLNSTSKDPTYLKARETILANLDATYGGDWWREIAEKRPDNWIETIAYEYVKRLGQALDAGWYRVPVRDRIGGATVYELVLFTQYPKQGLWHFHQSVSLASAEYRAYCRNNQDDDQLTMDLDEEGTWIKEIKRVIQERLKKGEFVIKDESLGIYGEALGEARETHVRKAVKQLYDEGITDCNGKGDVPELRITVGSGKPRAARTTPRKPKKK